MQYGHFDEEAREYVIDRPDTPKAWTNYLGDTTYGAVVTNHGGGYSFYKSAGQGRLLRFRTNAVPDGMPGRIFYLRDKRSGEFWAAGWQPVGSSASFQSCECRHGTAYTTIRNVTADIESDTTYFVPLGKSFEVWRLRLTNRSAVERAVDITSYCEFASNWTIVQDLLNVQYSAYIVQASMVEGAPGVNPILRVGINDNLPEDAADFTNNDQSRHVWMALCGAALTGYETDREAFLGPWRTYDRPVAVETGRLSNSFAYGDTASGALGASVTLAPGETRELAVLIGVGEAASAGCAAVEQYAAPAQLEEELRKLKAHWHARLDSLTVRTPDPAFNQMMNTWGLYNSLITFAWSRSASLVYNGERDGLGYRDTVQDILGVIAAVPEEARDRLELMLTGQVSSGGAMSVVRPFAHRPGHEPVPDPEKYRSDDCLWLFNTVPAYVAETGDLGFYHKTLPYADSGEATVLGHLRRALEFNLERTGRNGLPCGLSADWNDCLKLGYHGESIMVTFQVRLGLSTYASIAQSLNDPAEALWALNERKKLDASIEAVCWDGNWYRWAIAEDGTVFGTADYPEGQVYLNTQVWAVISGAASPERAKRCMETMHERLATEYGLILCDPPFTNTGVDVMRAVLFNPGTKENAGIFTHPQSWAVMAECLLGNGDRAYEYHRAYLPAAQNDRAEMRQVEPYVHCQSAHGKHSPQFGSSRLPWLTGAASWTYFTAAQCILGLRPEAGGFVVDPCIPSHWPGFEAVRRFRGKVLHIKVNNPNGICRGVKSLCVDGVAVEGVLVPDSMLHDGTVIEVELG